MARFKKEGGKSVPGINTGSMSDIIFMFPVLLYGYYNHA